MVSCTLNISPCGRIRSSVGHVLVVGRLTKTLANRALLVAVTGFVPSDGNFIGVASVEVAFESFAFLVV